MRKLLTGFLIGVALTDAYRVDSFRRNVEAKSKSSGRVTFHRVRAKGEATSNSSIFITAGLCTFAGTAVAVSAAPATVVASAAATTLAANCAPSLIAVTGTVAAGAAAPPLAAIVVPLAVIVVLAVIGGLVLLHTAAVAAAAAVAFCPVSSFAEEPMNVLVSMEPNFAFPDLAEVLSPAVMPLDGGGMVGNASMPAVMGLDGGMPQCSGMKTKELQQTFCGPDDRECLEKACRTKCCEDEQCTFYQFELEEGDELTNPSCQIGAKHKLAPDNCDKPYFGEVCSSRIPLWDKVGDGQCAIGYADGNGYEVEDQLDCQNVAAGNIHYGTGQCWYQYNEERKTCLTCDNYDTKRARKAIDGWAVYHDPTCDGKSIGAPLPSCSWKMNNALKSLSLVKDTKRVKPKPRGCRDMKATCMKKRCRAECQADADCKFYQFQEDEQWCYLGYKDAIADDDFEKRWIGGFVSEVRKCQTGFQCPANNKCVDSCMDGCPGFSIDGDEVKEAAVGKAASGKWCVRDAVENLCFERNWEDNYQGVKVDEWCRGLERVTVTIDEVLDATETGEKICQTTCCGDPDCSLYQMYEKDAEKTFTDKSLFQDGKKEKISCWLGMQTPGQKPKFKCTGNRPKRWRNLPPPRGMALKERGCSQGSIACLVKHGCVEHCATECMGADIHNKTRGVCQPRTSLEEEHLGSTESERQKHKLAFQTNIVSGLPKIAQNKGKLADDSYFLLADDVDVDSPAAKDNLLHVQSHAQNIVNPKGGRDVGAACETLKDNSDDEWHCWLDDVSGSCKCEFGEPQDCDAWFKNAKHMKHVVDSEAGMMLFPGDQCHCEDTPNEDGAYECTFVMKTELPPLRTVENAEAVMELKATAPKVCEDMPNPCAGFATCEVVNFGNHACGYSCMKPTGSEYWCTKDCVCTAESASDEVGDAMCTNGHVCPGMTQCDVIDYGDYGCGYGCQNAEGVFHFCEHTCECSA